MSKTYQKEIKALSLDSVFCDIERSCTFLITGATGMIGSYLVDLLMQLNADGFEINVYAAGRDLDKLKLRFSNHLSSDFFHTYLYDTTLPLNQHISFDYIVHAASNANPRLFATQPVETLLGNVVGLNFLLDYAAKHDTKRVLFVSSGEVYGIADKNTNAFVEEYSGYVDYSSPRACYPSGKRAAEVLCQSYISEYNVDAVIVRPCHIYGPTMLSTDSRAISQFIRCGINKENIIMQSTGTQVRSHCYISDTIRAFMYILIYGKCGEAYNVSGGMDSDISIKDLAQEISQQTNVELIMRLPSNAESSGFSKVPRAVLSHSKLTELGWEPLISISNGLKQTITILEGK